MGVLDKAGGCQPGRPIGVETEPGELRGRGGQGDRGVRKPVEGGLQQLEIVPEGKVQRQPGNLPFVHRSAPRGPYGGPPEGKRRHAAREIVIDNILLSLRGDLLLQGDEAIAFGLYAIPSLRPG
jgi:hypothetical protein